MQLLNLFDYEEAASAVMEPGAFAYYAGGVAENITRDENRRAFSRLRLRPKMLRDVSQPSMETEIMGVKSSMPIMLAPAAMHKLAHPIGELGTAEASHRAGIIQVLSTMSTVAIDEVVQVNRNLWFQLYIFRDRSITERLVERANAAQAQALVVTVDVPTLGLRENLIRANFTTPTDMTFPNFEDQSANLSSNELMRHATHTFDPSVTWKDIEWLRTLTDLPIWVKGILRGDDAKTAVDHGVAGIMVSNHGGRQLDTAIASIDALPDVVQAVDGACDIILDSGVRRGTDVVKAIALGAKAVMLGRSPLWGLAVNGADGAHHVLELMREEIANAMAQCGCPTLADIGPDLIASI